jgi:hypothetical protein
VYAVAVAGLVAGLAIGLVVVRPRDRAHHPARAAAVEMLSAAQVEVPGVASAIAPAPSAPVVPAASPAPIAAEVRAASPSPAESAIASAAVPSAPGSSSSGGSSRRSRSKKGEVTPSPASGLEAWDTALAADSAPPPRTSSHPKRAGKTPEKKDGAKSDWLEPWDGPANGGAK